MSQPPQGEDPQSPWARPDPSTGAAPGSRPVVPGESGWGPPSAAPGQPTERPGWGASPRPGQPGPYGPSRYGQPPQFGPPPQYGPSPHGQPDQYGQPGGWGPPPGGSGRWGGWGPPSGPFTEGEGSRGGWGPPAPPARTPSRRPRRLGLVVLAVLLVVAALTLPSPFGSTRLDPAAVERAVAGQFEDREGTALDLSCAEELAVRDGATYACAGRTADGEPVTITITLRGEDGDYTWDAG